MLKILLPTLILISTLVACENKKEDQSAEKISPEVVNNPATANTTSTLAKDALPVLEFEKTNHHFGDIIQGEKVSYSFKFKNTGNAPLIISSANATCGCTVPEYTKTPIEPDEEGFIDVTFDSGGKSGMESKTVTIIANTIPNSTILTISAEISVPENTNTN